MTYWYCLNHHAVEGPDGCAYKDRLGPYDTEEEAVTIANDTVYGNEEWDNDPRWNDELED